MGMTSGIATVRAPALLLWSAAATLRAQTLDDVREGVREAAQASRYSTFLAGLLGLTGESELSGGQFTIDGDPEIEVSLITYPLHQQVSLDDDWPLLHVEAEFGYARARTEYADIYSGTLPGLETRAKSRYETWGGFLGAGPVLPAGDLEVTPVALVGLSSVENETYYEGPGAPLSQAIFDGILFNWDATYAVYGGALLLTYGDLALGDVQVMPRLRYDVRRTDPLSTDDPAQGGTNTWHWLIARIDLEGGTGWRVSGKDVWWTAELGYKRFLDETGDLLGFRDYFEIGAGVRWDCGDAVPLVEDFGIVGAVQIGEDVSGWSIGAVVHF